MSFFLRCFNGPAAREPPLQQCNPIITSPTSSAPPESSRPRASSLATREQATLARLEVPIDASSLSKAVSSLFGRLCNVSGDHSVYCRTSLLLETCRKELSAYDVRLACFATDGATLVFLPSPSAEPDSIPAAAGWGYTPLYRLLSDNPESVVILRGYHAAALQTPPQQPQAPCPGGARVRSLGAASAEAAAPPTTGVSTNASAAPVRVLGAAGTVDGVAGEPPCAGYGGCEVSGSRGSPPSGTPASGPQPRQLCCRTSPPEPYSLVCRTASEPVPLQPQDLLALPVRLEDRVAAALLVGWAKPPPGGSGAGTASSSSTTCVATVDGSPVRIRSLLQHPMVVGGTGGPGAGGAGAAAGAGEGWGSPGPAFVGYSPDASGQAAATVAAAGFGFQADPDALAALQRLAQFISFGLMCDVQQRRMLALAAQRFSLLPAANGLHELVGRLLDAVAEMIHVKFSVRLQPILLLTHGFSAGGPAVLFSARQDSQSHTPTPSHLLNSTSIANGGCGCGAGAGAGTAPLGVWGAGPGGGVGGGQLPLRLLSGLRDDGAAADGGGSGSGGEEPSRVRATRISLHHTLLAEALRSAAKLAAADSQLKTSSGQRSGGSGSGSGDISIISASPRSSAAGWGAGGWRGQLGAAHGAGSYPRGQGIPMGPALPTLEPCAPRSLAAVGAIGAASVAGCSPPSAGPAPAPPPSCPPIYTTVVSNMAAHMLEEGAPCRDLLLCSNLAANCGTTGTTGSLVLAVEAVAPPPGGAAAVLASMRTAASILATVGGGRSVSASAPEVGRRSNTQMAAAVAAIAAPTTATAASRPDSSAVPALAALSQPLEVLHSQRQFGMYAVCGEVLPPGVLADIAAELRQLLGLALGSCREGALSVFNGGRCGWELYGLQEQLLGLSQQNTPGTAGAASPPQSLAAALAVAVANASAAASAASTSAPSALMPARPSGSAGSMGLAALLGSGSGASSGVAGRGLQEAEAAATAAAAAAASVGTRGSSYYGGGAGGGEVHDAVNSVPGGPCLTPSASTGREGPQGRALPRLLFSVTGSPGQVGSGLAAAGTRSDGAARLSPAHMQLGAAVGGEAATPGGSPSEAGRLLLGAGSGGVAAEADVPSPSGAWLLTSSPGLFLEPPAAGPSPLEVMVTSMRSGLNAALTNAVTTDRGDDARAMMSQELAALRLYDIIGRGGQGVVFYGTLHGLETAVKVIVHRGKGEPLAHDGGDPGMIFDGVVDGGCGGAAAAIAVAASAATGDAGGGGGEELVAAAGGDAAGAEDRGVEGNADLSRIRKAKRGALELVVTSALSHPNIVQVLATFSDVIMVRCTYRHEPIPRLRLVAKDDPILAGWEAPGPLNTVACLEYCDAGTLLEAAHAGAFRPPGSCDGGGSGGAGGGGGSGLVVEAVRPALVPLYMSLLEVALALRYLHSRRLVHCDVKPANVLLKSAPRDPRGWSCKLSDFGCVRLMTDLPALSEDQQQQRAFPSSARRTDGSQPAPEGAGQQQQGLGQGQGQGRQPQPQPQQPPATVLGFRLAQPLGTIAYMAPESFVRGHTLGPSIDIYAFGILMYEVLMCRAPYVGIDAQTLPRLVLRQHLRPEFHPLAPPEYCNLAARCWSSHASRRPTASQLVNEIEALLSDAQLRDSRTAHQASAAAASIAAATAAAAGPRAAAAAQSPYHFHQQQHPQQQPHWAAAAVAPSQVLLPPAPLQLPQMAPPPPPPPAAAPHPRHLLSADCSADSSAGVAATEGATDLMHAAAAAAAAASIDGNEGLSSVGGLPELSRVGELPELRPAPGPV